MTILFYFIRQTNKPMLYERGNIQANKYILFDYSMHIFSWVGIYCLILDKYGFQTVDMDWSNGTASSGTQLLGIVRKLHLINSQHVIQSGFNNTKILFCFLAAIAALYLAMSVTSLNECKMLYKYIY